MTLVSLGRSKFLMVLSYGMGASWVRKRRLTVAIPEPVRLLESCLEVVLNIVEKERDK